MRKEGWRVIRAKVGQRPQKAHTITGSVVWGEEGTNERGRLHTGDPERGAALRIEWAVQGIVRFHPNFVNKQTKATTFCLQLLRLEGEILNVSVRGLLRSHD